jgi:UDP-GlcNAc:undecaprenyl-phosphate GlcNAc-1-phosphate transferase
MTGAQSAAVGAGLIAGGVVTALGVRFRSRPGARAAMVRINVNGRSVPVVLGAPVVVGALAGVAAAVAVLARAGEHAPYHVAAASTLVVILLWGAGEWDDHRGDERARGFAGHLASARSLHVTGGIVKLGAGVAAGLAAGALVANDGTIIEVALLVALGANTINLLDRAPGRAGKVALAGLVPLAALGATAWTVTAAGSIAAVAVALPTDLRERAMLGDAGANPIGGILGLGLGVSLPEGWRWVAIIVLLALNLASERWSFSRAIARVGFLEALDRIGRR